MGRVRVKRPIRVDGEMAYIPLTRGYEAVIDLCDIPIADGRNWWAQVDSCNVYAVSLEAGKPVRLHREILHVGEGMVVDHKDGDGLNNRRDNLREATAHQNQRNQKKRKDNTSGKKGAYFHKIVGRYAAQIAVNGVQRHVGYFDTIDEAHAAYCEASKKYHGEFGRSE